MDPRSLSKHEYRQFRKALNIAVEKHEGRFRGGGIHYVFHPLSVMMQCETMKQKIVALLHDVVEDTDMTMEDLSYMGFDLDVLDALSLLTRIEGSGQSYEEYIKMVKLNPLAKAVKICDLKDNINSVDGIGNEQKRDFLKRRWIDALAELS